MIRNVLNTGEQHRLLRKATAAVVLAALLLAAGGGTGTAAAQTDINACTNINSAGSYEVTQEIGEVQGVCVVVSADDVAIDGNGNRINSTTAGVIVSPPSGQDSVTNVTVENLTVTNSFAGLGVSSAEDVEVTDVETSSTYGGMAFENTTDVNVEDVSVSLVDFVGVTVNDSDNVTVRDSFVTSEAIFSLPPGFDPGDFIDDPTDDPFEDPSDLLSEDSSLETQSHTGDQTGIFFNNTINGKIVDNTVTEFEGPGVEVLSSGPPLNFDPGLPDPPDLPDLTLSSGELTPAQSSPNEVSENEVRDNTEGIVLEDSFGYGVVDNTVSNNSDDGIVLDSSTSAGVTENTVDESGRHGIWLVGGSNFNDLTDNVAEDNDRAGIYLGVVGGLDPANNNTLVNNTARRNEYGIRLNNAFDNDVSESLVENNAEGISVEEELFSPLSEGVETEFVRQSGNTFTDDVSRNNNDWDFVVDSAGPNPVSVSTTSSDFPVTNLSIGASTAPDTTLSFNADDVRLGSVDSPEPDPDDLENIGRYFEAEQTSPDAFLNVSLSYEDTDVSGVNESTLELQRFVSTEWVTVADSSVDTANNELNADLTDFSDFGAFAEPAEGFKLDDYRNNGVVDTAGLQQAINDFVQGRITTGDLQAVINAFVQGSAP